METAIDGAVAIYAGIVGVFGLFGIAALFVRVFDELVKAVAGE